MRITARKVLSATQRVLVEDTCSQRNVDVEIIDRGAWIHVKMTGESDAIAAAWACIRAGRNDR
jgi:hypothetical protein